MLKIRKLKILQLFVIGVLCVGSSSFASDLIQHAYIKASNTGLMDQFGYSVATDGLTLVVGARYEDSNGSSQLDNSAHNAGAVYVYIFENNNWVQQAYLKADNADDDDYFGWSVDISGDTIVVGAYTEDSNATGINQDGGNDLAENSGAAYVFVRTGGVWAQEAYIKASNTDAEDRFGKAVAISDDTIVVTATSEDGGIAGINQDDTDNSSPWAGAAYVFTRSIGTWSQQAYIKSSNTETRDFFGWSVDISGDTMVIGSASEDSNATGINNGESDNSASAAGAAYVFIRDNSDEWSQQAYLKASNTEEGDKFGDAVSIDGDTIVVGADTEDSSDTGVGGNQNDNGESSSGAVYVFTRLVDSWSQQAYIKASNTGSFDQFGYAVALSGDSLIVGAYGEQSISTGVNQDELDDSASSSGAAYTFARNMGAWAQTNYIKPSNTDANDRFAYTVSVSNGRFLIGSYQEDSIGIGVNGNDNDNSSDATGSAYVFSSDSIFSNGFE